MSIFEGISIVDTFSLVNEIKKGMSGDRKFYIETIDGKKLLLRITEVSNYETKKKNYDFLLCLNEANLPVPKAIDFGVCEGGKSVYTLLEWMEGEEAEKVVPNMAKEKQYSIGMKSGRILRIIHENSKINGMEQDWYDRYFEVNIHGDYHLGNLIINSAEEIFVIDWQTVDFEGGADPWFDFTRIGIEYPAFAAGQIDGYFNHQVPEEFWRILALYLTTSAITSIVWAKYFAPDRLDSIVELNMNIVNCYDKMNNIIPAWYKDVKQNIKIYQISKTGSYLQ